MTYIIGVKNVKYAYDAENRLKSAEPQSPEDGNKKVEFVYDYLGRRVRKQVFDYSGGVWQLNKEILFVWVGLNVIDEITREVETGDETSKHYVHGLEQSGTLKGTGGIGGLDASVENATTNFFCYDEMSNS